MPDRRVFPNIYKTICWLWYVGSIYAMLVQFIHWPVDWIEIYDVTSPQYSTDCIRHQNLAPIRVAPCLSAACESVGSILFGIDSFDKYIYIYVQISIYLSMPA